MTTIQDIAELIEASAPRQLAEEWDNVGLLVGDGRRPARRIMTCLTITPGSAAEAVREKADLVVTHHPLPFRPLKRLTSGTPEGRMLLDLIEAHVAVYSAHTAFDSAAKGINQQLAQGLGLAQIEPIVPGDELSGSGRMGRLQTPQTLAELVERVKAFLAIEHLQYVGDDAHQVRKLGIACGSGGDFLDAAQSKGCDCLLTGETRFHTALAAEAQGVGLILAGHFASERFALVQLAGWLDEWLPGVHVWPSRSERDPVRWA
ncbi:MAG: Nif3-like dinuclear metal center hexameric protein [Pirellulales bacterium]